ncbi:hypothetical protein [Nostoc sp.]|uniref:hypothetical protein n=1 Tax=Nostoc sp. TaxID=1180 RepID=UPI002FF71760
MIPPFRLLCQVARAVASAIAISIAIHQAVNLCAIFYLLESINQLRSRPKNAIAVDLSYPWVTPWG